MHLADLLQRCGFLASSSEIPGYSDREWREALELRAGIIGELSDSPIVHCDNVVYHFFDVNNERDRTRKEWDFPNLAPPFPCFFVEYPVPPRLRKDHVSNMKRVGVAVSSVPLTSGGWEIGAAIYFSDFREEGVLGPLSVTKFRVSQDGRFQELLAEVYAKDEFLFASYPDLATRFVRLHDQLSEERDGLDRLRGQIEGNVNRPDVIKAASDALLGSPALKAPMREELEKIGSNYLRLHSSVDRLRNGVKELQERTRSQMEELYDKITSLEVEGRQPLIAMLLGPVLMSISLMHCKNVAMREEVPSPRKIKVDRKRGRKPPLRYHVLEVFPAGRQVQRSRVSYDSDSQRHQSLHICRGHFKTFTANKPLFGHCVGTYWWADQVRGRAEEGVVVKDYRIKGVSDTLLGDV